MPTLAFKVQADWEKVVRLREEIAKLKAEMKGVDAFGAPAHFNALNRQLKQCTTEYNSLTTEAVRAGARIEGDFKRKVYDAQQSVNRFTDEIIAQKKVIYDASEEFRKLTAMYKELKRQGDRSSADAMVPQIRQAKDALDGQKRSLFELTQERAKSQLGLKKLREEEALFAKESGASINVLAKLKSEIMGLGAGMLAGLGLKELGSAIIRVRGQFQQADTAIQTMLGSEDRARSLLADVREYAKISPLEFGDITRVMQMMLGFNIEAEKVPGFIKAIGDVSMGESGKFNSLSLAFSQMSAAGKLMGQDLLQMINAGFNPLTVMAEKTGKSVAQLKEEMSKGAISAEMVQQAFIDATSAGGKFYNMSENAAKTINGQLSMMHDAIDSALNSIGTDSEGLITGSISAITKLIESYETVGRVLAGLTVTYGAYRTAVALVTFAQNGHTLAMTMARAQILLTQKAQALLNATMLANPYVLAAVALGGLIGATIAFSDTLSDAEHAQRNFNAAVEENNRKIQEEKEEIDRLLATLTDENEAQGKRTEAYQTLIDKYPEIFAKYKTEKDLIDNLTEARQRENAEIERKARLLSQQTYDEAKTRAKELNRLKQLTQKGPEKLKGADLAAYKNLYGKYRDEIMRNQTWYGTRSGAIERLSNQAQYEYNLNVDENRKKNVTDRNKLYREMKKADAEAEKKRINALIRKANETGKKYIKLGDDEPVSVDQAKDYVKTLQTNISTTRKTLKEWRKGAEEEARKNKKTQKTLEQSTELLTKEEAQKIVKEQQAANQTLDAGVKSFTIQDKSGDKAAKKAAAEARKQAEAEEKMHEVRTKQQIAQERADRDLAFSTREAEIKAMRDGTDRKLRQIELDRDREMDAIARAYEDLRQSRISEAKKLWDADPRNKGRDFYQSDEYTRADVNTEAEGANKAAREKAVQAEYAENIRQLTSEYETAIDQRAEKMRKYNDDIAAMTELRNKAEKEGNDDAVRGLDERIKLAKVLRDISQTDAGEEDYNINYGTWSQKLEATNARFQRQMAEANAKGDSGLVKSLQKQWEEAVAELDINKLKEHINWDVIFGNLSGVSKKRLKEVERQMDTFLKSPKFRKMTPANQKALADAFHQIQEELNDRGGIFQGLIDATGEYRTALEELRIATEEYDEAVKKFGEDSSEAQEALRRKNAAERNAQNAGGKQKDALDGTIDKVNKISEMARSMASAGDDAVGALSSVFGTLGQVLGSSGGWAGIVGAILSILDMIGDQGLDGFIGDVLDGVGHAVGGILDTIGSVFGISGLGGVFGGADTKQYDAMVSEYNSLIDVWDRLLDAKTKYIEMSYGPEAVKAGREAEGIVEREIAAWRTLGKERMNAGSSKGSHSYGYRSRESMTGEDWNAVARSLGRSVDDYAGLGSRLTGLFDLTAEQLEKLRDDAPGFWAKLDDDAQDYLNKIIEGTEKIGDIQKKVQEQMTSTTFDSLKSSFAEALYDMEGTAQKRGKKIKDALFKSIVDNFILGSDFDAWLDTFFTKWADKIGTGDMSSFDWDSYTREYNDMLEKKIAERDRWAAAMGYTGEAGSEQSASVQAMERITTDQAEELVGRMNAGQIIWQQGNDQRREINEGLTVMNMTIADMRSIGAEQRDIANDTRDILASSYLELREINEHQDKIEKAVTGIQSEVREIRSNIKSIT